MVSVAADVSRHAGIRSQRLADRRGRPAWCVVIALVAATWRVHRRSARRDQTVCGHTLHAGCDHRALVIAVAPPDAERARDRHRTFAGDGRAQVAGVPRRDDGIVIGVALFMLLASALATQSLTAFLSY
jgi:hypothetical protein